MKQVARNVSPCNVPDHKSPIFTKNSLQDKLHSVTAPLWTYGDRTRRIDPFPADNFSKYKMNVIRITSAY